MAYCNKTTLPSCNRLLEKKWDERRLQAHHQKVLQAICQLITSSASLPHLHTQLRSMKSSLDNKPPPDFVHIRQNLRKAQVSSAIAYTPTKYEWTVLIVGEGPSVHRRPPQSVTVGADEPDHAYHRTSGPSEYGLATKEEVCTSHLMCTHVYLPATPPPASTL